jgi:hypothetical protein
VIDFFWDHAERMVGQISSPHAKSKVCIGCHCRTICHRRHKFWFASDTSRRRVISQGGLFFWSLFLQYHQRYYSFGNCVAYCMDIREIPNQDPWEDSSPDWNDCVLVRLRSGHFTLLDWQCMRRFSQFALRTIAKPRFRRSPF